MSFGGNLSNAALSTPSSVELVLTGPVAAPPSTTTLGAFFPTSPVYGQAITLSAMVTGANGATVTPLGTVVFTVDGNSYNATLTNGAASTTVSGLSAGSHAVIAAYTISNGYAASNSSPSTLVVAQAVSMVPVAANPNPAAQGKPVTLTASVTGAGQIGAAVTFTSGSTMLCSSGVTASEVAACRFTPTASGTLSIVAQYQGDANHLSSSVGVSLPVYE